MKYLNILHQTVNKIAEIKLNRPNVLNSFNFQMADEVLHALEKCNSDQNIRAIILSGAGRAFCAGQDLEEATKSDGPTINEIIPGRFTQPLLFQYFPELCEIGSTIDSVSFAKIEPDNPYFLDSLYSILVPSGNIIIQFPEARRSLPISLTFNTSVDPRPLLTGISLNLLKTPLNIGKYISSNLPTHEDGLK